MTTIIIGAFLTVTGSMMNSNKKSNIGVLLAVAGVALAVIPSIASAVMKGGAA